VGKEKVEKEEKKMKRRRKRCGVNANAVEYKKKGNINAGWNEPVVNRSWNELARGRGKRSGGGTNGNGPGNCLRWPVATARCELLPVKKLIVTAGCNSPAPITIATYTAPNAVSLIRNICSHPVPRWCRANSTRPLYLSLFIGFFKIQFRCDLYPSWTCVNS